jgi:fructose-1,6-bisphosphatase/inositol monophosphatase family enzyme
MDLEADIALALRLADAAGAAIRPHFRSGVASERKGDATPVTEADRAAEEAMRRILKAEVPRDTVIGEEFGAEAGTSGRSWVLDPIDGTAGFLAGRAIFGTLIALVVEGWPVLGVIDQPIAGERWVGARGRPTTLNGKPARTRYRTINRFTRPTDLSHLECHLESGRTHQIRVHLAAAGHPVVGDGTYGGTRSALSSPRPFLHAATLAFGHPVTGEVLTFESPLPADLVEVLSTLE